MTIASMLIKQRILKQNSTKLNHKTMSHTGVRLSHITTKMSMLNFRFARGSVFLFSYKFESEK